MILLYGYFQPYFTTVNDYTLYCPTFEVSPALSYIKSYRFDRARSYRLIISPLRPCFLSELNRYG